MAENMNSQENGEKENKLKKVVVSIKNFVLKNKRLSVLLAILIALLPVLLITYFSKHGVLTKENSQFDKILSLNKVESLVTPTIADENGVNVKSEFIIKGKKFASAEVLLSKLTVNTDIKYTVKSQQDGDYKLSFSNPLEANKIYNFVFKEEDNSNTSCAFQTKAEFSILSTFPTHKGSHVPVNTGIEISFTNSDLVNFNDFIIIEPKVNIKFETLGSTLIIKPEKALQSRTRYYLTVKKGFTTKSGEKLKEDYTFYFDTSNENNPNHISISGDNVETFLTDDIPVVEIIASNDFLNTNLKTEVLQIPTYEEYSQIVLKTRENYNKYSFENDNAYEIIDLKTASKKFDFQSKLVAGGAEDYSPKYIVLPQKLSEGYYIINISGEYKGAKIRLQKFIQSHNFAVYAKSDREKALIWVNSTLNKLPVGNAQVFIDGSLAGNTAEDGTFQYKVNGNKREAQIVIKNEGNNPFVTTLSLIPSAEKQSYEKYFTYLYTDRQAYLCTETIKIFGFLKSRDGSSLPNKLKLNISKSGEDAKSLVETEVQISSSGVFTAEIKTNNFSSDYYKINLLGDGKIIASTYIDVFNYVKPLYKIEYDNIPKTYFDDEKIPFGATVSFYGGTPAKGLPFEIKNDNNTVAKVTTDDNGRITANLNCTAESENNSWNARYINYNITCTSPQDNMKPEYIAYGVLPRTVMLTGEIEKKNLIVKTNLITKEKVLYPENVYGIDEELLRGAAIDTSVDVTLMKVSYTKKKTGTFYNYIEKTVNDKYEYERIENVVSKQTVNTKNGTFTLENIPAKAEEGVSYYYILKCKDTKNREIEEKVWCQNNYYNYYQTLNSYFLKDANQILYADKKYNIGEIINLNLINQKDMPITSGTVLCTVMKEGMIDKKISTALPFDIEFKDNFVPDVFLDGAYFDGKRIYSIDSRRFDFNEKSRELKINVTTDKQSYKPGETVNLKVSITDANNNPKMADINLSVVDEAQFAVSPQNADILGSLYDDRFGIGEVSSYVSFRQHIFDGSNGAEEGGEGSDNERKDFVDNAAFLTIKTGADGKATASFKLHDNITDWRITSNAISADLYAGNNKTIISSNLPMFADMVNCSTYLAEDDVSIFARAYGKSINDNSTVSLTATITDQNGKSVQKTASTKGSSGTSFNFGKQPVGTYKITLKAQSAGLSDTIEKTVSVVNNNKSVYLTKTFDLSAGIDINALKSPLTLSVYNKGTFYTNEILQNIFYSSPKRNDQIIAKICAAKLLGDLDISADKSHYEFGNQYKVGDFQLENGGAAIYSYAADDPLLTAKLILAKPELFISSQAVEYFNKIIKNEKETKERICAAYLGLAVYKQPILIKIKSLISTLGEKEYKAKLSLIIALTVLGDDAGASELYNKHFGSITKEDKGIYACINSKDAQVINDELSALSLIVLSRTDKNAAEKFMRYILDNESNVYYSGIEKILYVKNVMPIGAVECSFEYYIKGEKKIVALKNNQIENIDITVENLKNANFKVISGTPEVNAVYVGNPDEIENKSADIQVKKTISPVNKNSDGKIHIGDLSIVSIKVKALKGTGNFFELSDYIPSGMRFVKYSSTELTNVGFFGNELQKAEFYLYKPYYDKNSDYEWTFSYYVRAVQGGSFQIDNTLVVGEKSDFTVSEKGSITIE